MYDIIHAIPSTNHKISCARENSVVTDIAIAVSVT